MPVEPAHSIARLGFRRWFERQLFESFAWLTTCLLSGVTFGAIFEFIGFGGPGIEPYVTLIVLYVVGLMGLGAWRRFWSTLSRAQALARAAVCPQCETYGLVEVMAETVAVPVRCRKCAREWSIGR